MSKITITNFVAPLKIINATSIDISYLVEGIVIFILCLISFLAPDFMWKLSHPLQSWVDKTNSPSDAYYRVNKFITIIGMLIGVGFSIYAFI